MDRHIIKSSEDPKYGIFSELYKTSFPIYEQRSTAQQEMAFQHEEYKLLTFLEQDTFIGFIAYWDFDSHCYIEHFAIQTSLRGEGYGSSILQSFIQSLPKKVLLEIDPITDQVSEAR